MESSQRKASANVVFCVRKGTTKFPARSPNLKILAEGTKGGPSNQNYKECVEWQKFQEAKRKLFSQGSNVESPKKVVDAKPETNPKGNVPDSKRPQAQ